MSSCRSLGLLWRRAGLTRHTQPFSKHVLPRRSWFGVTATVRWHLHCLLAAATNAAALERFLTQKSVYIIKARARTETCSFAEGVIGISVLRCCDKQSRENDVRHEHSHSRE